MLLEGRRALCQSGGSAVGVFNCIHVTYAGTRPQLKVVQPGIPRRVTSASDGKDQVGFHDLTRSISFALVLPVRDVPPPNRFGLLALSGEAQPGTPLLASAWQWQGLTGSVLTV